MAKGKSVNARNSTLARAYVEKNGFLCMTPGCGSTLESQAHHIRPMARGGKDIEENLIVLCHKHHRTSGVHSDWEAWHTTLLTWKFFYELGGGCEDKKLSALTAKEVSQREIDTTSIARIPAVCGRIGCNCGGRSLLRLERQKGLSPKPTQPLIKLSQPKNRRDRNVKVALIRCIEPTSYHPDNVELFIPHDEYLAIWNRRFGVEL